MPPMPIALTLAALLSATAAWPSVAAACKCRPQSIAEAERASDAIFEGRVELIETAKAGATGSADALRVDLAVVRRFKGGDAERLQVQTRADGPACGYGFERGKSYLVYASLNDGQLWVTRCSRTRPIAEAEEDLGALGMGTTPVDVKNTPPLPAAPPEPTPADCRAVAGPRAGAAWAPWLAVGLIARRRLRRSRRSRSRS